MREDLTIVRESKLNRPRSIEIDVDACIAALNHMNAGSAPDGLRRRYINRYVSLFLSESIRWQGRLSLRRAAGQTVPQRAGPHKAKLRCPRRTTVMGSCMDMSEQRRGRIAAVLKIT